MNNKCIIYEDLEEVRMRIISDEYIMWQIDASNRLNKINPEIRKFNLN